MPRGERRAPSSNGTGAAAATVTDAIAVISAFLRAHRPPSDACRELTASIVAAMADAPSGTRVGELADRFAITTRTLQRLFALHVGASPKAVLQQRRLQDATDRLRAEDTPLALMAAE